MSEERGGRPLRSPQPVEEPDEVLAARVAAGDRQAFDSLVLRYHRRIRSICLRMSSSPEEAEDMSQETFLRMFKYASSYQKGRRFTSWLDRICVNVCLRRREQTKKEDRTVRMGDREPEAAEGSATRAAFDPESQARTSEIKRKLATALESVAAPYRAALVLRVVGELSYQEIADRLQCSIGTVMSRINRARTKLREQLKDKL